MGPGGIITSMVEMVPTLAGAETLLASTKGFNSNTGWLVNTNPTFCFNKTLKDSNSGILVYSTSFKKAKSSSVLSHPFILKSKAFLITVFFPITRCPLLSKIVLLIY